MAYCLIPDAILFRFWLISQKFNSGVTDGRTDRRTDTPSYRDARTHLKIIASSYHRVLTPSPFSLLRIVSSLVHTFPFCEAYLTKLTSKDASLRRGQVFQCVSDRPTNDRSNDRFIGKTADIQTDRQACPTSLLHR